MSTYSDIAEEAPRIVRRGYGLADVGGLPIIVDAALIRWDRDGWLLVEAVARVDGEPWHTWKVRSYVDGQPGGEVRIDELRHHVAEDHGGAVDLQIAGAMEELVRALAQVAAMQGMIAAAEEARAKVDRLRTERAASSAARPPRVRS